MAGVIDDGLCLRVWDWSETSQTALVFTRGAGVVRGLAKGAKRPKHPYSGGLEMLTLGRVGVIVRAGAELALITSWDLSETFPALRRSLAVHHAGLYVADTLQHAIRDHDPHAVLFDQAVECLRMLARSDGQEAVEQIEARIAPAMLKFQWSVLVETGYKPELDADVQTGEPIDVKSEGALSFAPALGGFCGSATGDLSCWRVRGGTLELLRDFASGGLEALAAREQTDPQSMDRVNRLLASYVRYVLGVEPATMTLVFGSRLAR